MDQDIVTNSDLRCVFKADLFNDAAKIGLSHSHPLRVLGDGEHFAWDRETHKFSVSDFSQTKPMGKGLVSQRSICSENLPQRNSAIVCWNMLMPIRRKTFCS